MGLSYKISRTTADNSASVVRFCPSGISPSPSFLFSILTLGKSAVNVDKLYTFFLYST
ncbi:protein of unknown function [Aminobacter niigataensis]|nr:protein of unknown function [Aminobacter niigataensis]